MDKKKRYFEKLRKIILRERKTINEINSLSTYSKNSDNPEEKAMVYSQIKDLKKSFKKTNKHLLKRLEKISLAKPLNIFRKEKEPEEEIIEEAPEKKHEKKETHKERKIHEKVKKEKHKIKPKKQKKKFKFKLFGKSKKEITELDKETLKRLKKKEEKITEEKTKKPSLYIKTANRFFSDLSRSIFRKKVFNTLEKDLTKTNLQATPITYISIILFTTMISVIVGIVLFFFFLFFNLGPELPIITLAQESLAQRFLKVFWLLIAVPLATFVITYIYPSLERQYAESQINLELPFAVINMSAIAGSMLEPSKIFSIIVATKEYKHLGKEFTKLLNEINIYGYDFVTALRRVANDSPSKNLADLFNSLATTITSGGNLTEFFEKRSETLLFEYRLEKEKYTKTAETFMDIYISVVIAAPMVLMLLLMMMRISGLGISLSSSMITLIMVLGVSVINIIFLAFLQLKKG